MTKHAEGNPFKALWVKEKPLAAMMLLTICVYSVLSIMKHLHFGSNAFDLGNFDQMAWNYSRFRAPGSTQLGLDNGLGDHFSPILALCAPLMWLCPRVEILLVAQAVLIALSFIPLFSYCERRIGRSSAYLLTASFAIFWGVQKTIWTDFHPDVLAVPIIAFAIYFIDVKKWAWASLSILLLLSVKEELTLLVAFFGIYLALNNQRKMGSALIIVGIVFFYIEVMVWIPYFAKGNRPEWIFTDLGPNPASAIEAVLKDPFKPIGLMFSDWTKIRTYLLLFGPFLFLPFFSKQFILLLPLLAAKELTNNPNMWDMSTHYSAFIGPILVTATADGLSKFSKNKPYAAVLILCINLFLIPYNSPWHGVERASFWRFNDTERTSALAFALIPPSASVGTQTAIAPHLTHRRTIYALDINITCDSIDPDYFIASRGLNSYPVPYSDVEKCLNEKMKKGYTKIFEKDGWFVLKR